MKIFDCKALKSSVGYADTDLNNPLLSNVKIVVSILLCHTVHLKSVRGLQNLMSVSAKSFSCPRCQQTWCTTV